MDEFTVVNRARTLVVQVGPTSIPVSVEAYANHVGAIVRVEDDLASDEQGWSFESNGKRYICVNGKDRPVRQRFTVCHELGHVVLGLPSEHSAGPWWSYARRSMSEIYCDVFAAELLLPYGLFKPLAERALIGLAPIDELAERFGASSMATGSRFASVVSAPCAFVFSEEGKVRYASRSVALRDAKAWIQPQMPVPRGSLSERVRAGESSDKAEEIAADAWFDEWKQGGVLLEEARYLEQWDQTLTLLWFEEEEVPQPKRSEREEIEEVGLKELDGTLPWPGKKRRR